MHLERNAESVGVATAAGPGLWIAAPNARALSRPNLALGGMPNQFPAGHWRHYREAFEEAFAMLTPVAVRLGYPET